MSREHLETAAITQLERLGIPLVVVNAALSQGISSDASDEFDTPEWTEEEITVLGHIAKSLRPSESQYETGPESFSRVEIWLPSSVTIVDGDDSGTVRATRVRDEVTGKTYRITNIFSYHIGVVICNAVEM